MTVLNLHHAVSTTPKYEDTTPMSLSSKQNLQFITIVPFHLKTIIFFLLFKFTVSFHLLQLRPIILIALTG